jgi:uncharacterized protein (TIGR02145 family)
MNRKYIVLHLFVSMLFVIITTNCKKDIKTPTILTTDVKNITTSTADFGGEIIDSASSTIIELGFCWSTKCSPTIENDKLKAKINTNVFKAHIEGLIPQSTYYVRAFITNSEGTYYGEEKTFTTLDSIVTDIEGNKYRTVTIGSQIWTAENLKTTKLNDGTDIPNITDGFIWNVSTDPEYCWFKNNVEYKNVYGALYNWYTVNTNKVCPTGWHVPSDVEWTTLELYLQANGYNYDGTNDNDTDRITNNKITKSLASNTGWNSSSIEGAAGNTDYPSYRNKSGFSGLPGGLHHGNVTFANAGTFGYWLSSSGQNNQSWYRSINFSSNNLYRDLNSKHDGMSIRCVKN